MNYFKDNLKFTDGDILRIANTMQDSFEDSKYYLSALINFVVEDLTNVFSFLNEPLMTRLNRFYSDFKCLANEKNKNDIIDRVKFYRAKSQSTIDKIVYDLIDLYTSKDVKTMIYRAYQSIIY